MVFFLVNIKRDINIIWTKYKYKNEKKNLTFIFFSLIISYRNKKTLNSNEIKIKIFQLMHDLLNSNWIQVSLVILHMKQICVEKPFNFSNLKSYRSIMCIDFDK